MRQFSGSNVSCMKDYVKLSIRENNTDHVIFHVGTNDVPTKKTPQVIVQSIVDLAKSVTNDNLQLTVSSIAPRNDQWSKEVFGVNKVLLNLCNDVNIPFISLSAIDAKGNLNKLHCNLNNFFSFFLFMFLIIHIYNDIKIKLTK